MLTSESIYKYFKGMPIYHKLAEAATQFDLNNFSNENIRRVKGKFSEIARDYFRARTKREFKGFIYLAGAIDNTKIDFSLQKEKRKMRKIHEKNTFIAVPPVLFGCLVRCKMDKGEFEEFSIRLDRRDNDAIHELVYFNVILEDISDDIWVEVHKATVGSNHELEYKFNVRNNLFRQGKYDQIPRIFVFVKKEQSTNVYVRRFIPKEIWKFYVRGYEKKDLMFFGSIGSEKDLDRYLTELGPEARVALEKEILSARVVIGQKFSKEIIKEYVQNTNPLSWSITDKIIAVREACKNRVYLKKSDELVELIHDPSGVNYFLQHAKLNPKGLFLKDPYCRNTGSDR